MIELYGPVYSVTHDWTVRLKFKKYELGASYSVLVYLGDTFVGAASAFTTSRPERCANCRENLDLEIGAFVHLNEKLVEKYSELTSLDPERVKPVLNRDLALRIEGEKPDGSRADFSDLPSIEAVVFSQKIIQTDRRGHSLPGLGIPDYHPDVRVGRREGTGGLQ